MAPQELSLTGAVLCAFVQVVACGDGDSSDGTDSDSARPKPAETVGSSDTPGAGETDSPMGPTSAVSPASSPIEGMGGYGGAGGAMSSGSSGGGRAGAAGAGGSGIDGASGTDGDLDGTPSCEETCGRSIGCPNDQAGQMGCVTICEGYRMLCPVEAAATDRCFLALDDSHLACNDNSGLTVISDDSCADESAALIACVTK